MTPFGNIDICNSCKQGTVGNKNNWLSPEKNFTMDIEVLNNNINVKTCIENTSFQTEMIRHKFTRDEVSVMHVPPVT